ncbi:MAG: ATP-binding protein [Candidatus Levybacteria bacterium]|nr:ATP-binding protein [Candidatus Levybacteria bacterium]
MYSLVAVVGARQAGKTTFLKEHSKTLKSTYLLFDDSDIRSIFEEDIKKFEKQYMENSDIFIFDEVQYCKNAGRNLKYLADNGKKIWLTSSSEMILSKEVLSYLVGRVSILRLYPFSLKEFLKAKGQKELTQNILERNIWEHILYGGYPKIVICEDNELKKTMLKDIYETMILKDIAQTFSIEDIKSLEEFTKHLSLNVGGLFSYETISKDLKISFQTARKYLDAMEKSYLIARISPFYRNKAKEIIKQPKIYFIDTGLRNIISRSFESEPDGNLFENYVASELIKSKHSIKYWRTKSKAEVDFILEKDKEIIPIEVKLKANEKIGKSLYSFVESYKPKRAFVVSYKGNKKSVKINDCEINFVDIHELIKALE